MATPAGKTLSTTSKDSCHKLRRRQAVRRDALLRRSLERRPRARRDAGSEASFYDGSFDLLHVKDSAGRHSWAAEEETGWKNVGRSG